MANEIKVPELGESVVEATVGKWLKKEGDRVEVGDVVVELETDKANLEVGAEHAGVIAKIEHGEGDDVEIGDVLAVIEASGGGASDGDSSSDGGGSAESASKSKAEASGKNASEKEGAAAETDAAASDAGNGAAGDASDRGTSKASPAARKLARERGVDLGSVRGSGAGRRITKEDVERFLADGDDANGGAAAKSAATSASEPAPKSDSKSDSRAESEEGASRPRATGSAAVAGERVERRVKMSRRRQTIARRLVESQQTAAILTTFNEIDMSGVMSLRERHKKAFEERHGVRLGFMSFFAKAAIAALREFPELNAEVQGTEIVYKDYYDIGIAVGAKEGLVVPVLRDADRMSFADVESRIREFAAKADEGALSIDDLVGGTFTISNGGVFGSLMATPIINPPQVGILGLHRIEDRPVAIDGEVVIRPMMYVALSYDHRIVDGRESVQFLRKIKDMVEDPAGLLLEG